MKTSVIKASTLDFLLDLAQNNNREWFANHKKDYEQARANVDDFFKAVEQQLNKTDTIEEYKIYRIYRDIRFSPDKTPYKTSISGYFKRAGAERRGSYWLHIQPGHETKVGGGFYAPEKQDLYRLRKEFETDPDGILKLCGKEEFRKKFKKIYGDSLKTAPKDFDKDSPAIDYIKMKQFYTYTTPTDAEVLSNNFLDYTVEVYQGIRPFFDYFSTILTTDLNGETII